MTFIISSWCFSVDVRVSEDGWEFGLGAPDGDPGLARRPPRSRRAGGQAVPARPGRAQAKDQPGRRLDLESRHHSVRLPSRPQRPGSSGKTSSEQIISLPAETKQGKIHTYAMCLDKKRYTFCFLDGCSKYFGFFFRFTCSVKRRYNPRWITIY